MPVAPAAKRQSEAKTKTPALVKVPLAAVQRPVP